MKSSIRFARERPPVWVVVIAVVVLPCPVRAAEKPESLFPALPDNVAIFAIGPYAGSHPLDVQLDDSGHDAAQADVVVNYPDRPVVLVLSAYNPTVWKVGRTEATKIAAVLVSGYHVQALIGIDRLTPHAMSTYAQKGPFSYFYVSGTLPDLQAMNETVREVVGRRPDKFLNEPEDGVFYVGDRPVGEDAVIYSDELTLADYVTPGRPLAGLRGLNHLVEEGKLRAATKEDIQAWVEVAEDKYTPADLARLRTGQTVRLTYVVLERITLPNGLYGGHSRAFIIPEGVPFPDGPPCHNAFYLMDGSARGTVAVFLQ